MLGLFLEHHLEAAAHDVLLVWIRVRRLATTHPIELGVGEPVDDTPLASLLPRREAAMAALAFYLGLEMLTRLDGDRSRGDAIFDAARQLTTILDTLIPRE